MACLRFGSLLQQLASLSELRALADLCVPGSPHYRDSPFSFTLHLIAKATLLQPTWVASLLSPLVFNGSPLSTDSRVSLRKRHRAWSSKPLPTYTLSHSCTLVRSKLRVAQMLSCPLLSLLLLYFSSIFVKILPLKILPSSTQGFSGPPAMWKEAHSPPSACLPSSLLCCNAVSLFTPASLPPTGLSAPLSTSLDCHCAHQARQSPDTRRVSVPPPCNNLPSFVLEGEAGVAEYTQPAHPSSSSQHTRRANCMTFCICGFLSLPPLLFFFFSLLFKHRPLELARRPG